MKRRIVLTDQQRGVLHDVHMGYVPSARVRGPISNSLREIGLLDDDGLTDAGLTLVFRGQVKTDDAFILERDE